MATAPMENVIYIPTVLEVISRPHRHDFAFPVFSERKPDSQPILTGYACKCGDVLERLFHSPAAFDL